MNPPPAMRIAMGQINPTVGAIDENSLLISSAITKAVKANADLLVLPELVICGYPPEDLLKQKNFIKDCIAGIEKIAKQVHRNLTLILGAPYSENGKLYNAAWVLSDKKVSTVITKTELPNYGVFDEARYFAKGSGGDLIDVKKQKIGVTLCEDIWGENDLLKNQAEAGADILVNISASPYQESILKKRFDIVSKISSTYNIAFVYLNIVGGQDELVFDGASFVCGSDGKIAAKAKRFSEDFLVVDIPSDGSSTAVIEDDTDEDIYNALKLGLKDYVEKSGFPGVVIAESGGIDSALTTAIAVDAIGSAKVLGVTMPSPFSSEGSLTDAEKLAKNFGIKTESIAIAPMMKDYDNALADIFEGKDRDVTEENIQARIRGALVMAISNKFGFLVLTTGNKSETAVGYCTLYGDMAGGLALIKDLYKHKVYDLAKYRNRLAGYDIIPNEIIDKQPSAELRLGQKDSDSLPPYDVLDAILKAYIEEQKGIEEITAEGFDFEIVKRVVKLVDTNEYKRRQAPIGIKISSKAFGRDRRHPIVCRYNSSNTVGK